MVFVYRWLPIDLLAHHWNVDRGTDRPLSRLLEQMLWLKTDFTNDSPMITIEIEFVERHCCRLLLLSSQLRFRPSCLSDALRWMHPSVSSETKLVRQTGHRHQRPLRDRYKNSFGVGVRWGGVECAVGVSFPIPVSFPRTVYTELIHVTIINREVKTTLACLFAPL